MHNSVSSSSSSHNHAYPFCTLTFFGLSLLEFVGLSFLPYFSPKSQAFATLFTSFFNQRDWWVLGCMLMWHALSLSLSLSPPFNTCEALAHSGWHPHDPPQKNNRRSVAYASEDRHAGAVFVDLYNRRLDLSVVTIRGTNPKNMFDVSGSVGELEVTGMGPLGWGREMAQSRRRVSMTA